MYGRINARRERFHKAVLFGRTVLFTPSLINRNSVPKGMRMYEIRANDIGQPDELAHSLTGPKYGTTGGFGSHPNSRGSACYCTDLYSGESSRFERYDILGTMPEDKLPDWAKKGLADIRAKQSEKKKTEAR